MLYSINLPMAGSRFWGATTQPSLLPLALRWREWMARVEAERFAAREIGRDLIARLHRQGLIARGLRSPEPGAPYTYVTTPDFLAMFRLETLRDLTDRAALKDAGLLEKDVDLGLPPMGKE